MKTIRVALGSNDGENIIADHMGMAEYFYIYDILETGDAKFIEKRKNAALSEKEDKHGLDKKRSAITTICSDVNIFLARRMSPNFLKIAENTTIQPIITTAETAADAIKKIVGSFDSLYDIVGKRNNGDRNKNIPKL